MKYLNRIKSLIVILLFVVIVAFPYYATFFNIDETLSGAIEKTKFEFNSLDDLKKVDDYVTENFPGRSFVLKTKNQLLYKYLDISPNSSIIKINDNLISTETLNYYYHGMYSLDEKEVDRLVSKLNTFNEFCKENGKKMLIIFTPTKLRYHDGVMPFIDYLISKYDKSATNNTHIKPYDILKNKLKGSDIYIFDSIELIDNDRYKYLSGKVPLFYKSGHHWSNYKAHLVALSLHDYMRDTMNMKIPKLSVKASKSDVAMDPDKDLFDILNIYDKPDEEFYVPIDEMIEYDSDNLNFTIQGGSFTSLMMFPPIVVSEKGNAVQIVNKQAFYNNYTNMVEFNNYDELNNKIGLLDRIKDTDCYIFEIHEVNVYNASFGFLDYLLKHKEEL